MSVNYLYDAAPAKAEIKQLDCGIGWVCLDLPFALDHVNVWLLDGAADSDAFVIVDTGINSKDTIDVWQQVFDGLGKSPDQLLATHYHPDHIGLAHWMQHNMGLQVMMSRREFEQASAAFSASDELFSQSQGAWYRQHGLTEERVEQVGAKSNSYRKIVSGIPTLDTELKTGSMVAAGNSEWRVITGGGHSPDQVTLYSEKENVLIAADQVLPRITPNISLNWYKNENDPLADFLDSFSAFEALPSDTLVLPSHGLPFHGLHERLRFLREHHMERLDLLLEATKKPATASDLLPVLFNRELDPRQMMFAMGEALAHLRFLENRQQLGRQTIDGQDFFQRL